MPSFTTSVIGVVFEFADGGDFQESRDARVAVQEIPGGDNFFVDRGGRSPSRIQFTAVLLNETIWGALNSALGLDGTLSLESLDSHAAILTKVSRPAPFSDGQVKASVEFLITDT